MTKEQIQAKKALEIAFLLADKSGLCLFIRDSGSNFTLVAADETAYEKASTAELWKIGEEVNTRNLIRTSIA